MASDVAAFEADYVYTGGRKERYGQGPIPQTNRNLTFDPATGISVTNFSIELCRELGWSEEKLKEVRMGGVLHDLQSPIQAIATWARHLRTAPRDPGGVPDCGLHAVEDLDVTEKLVRIACGWAWNELPAGFVPDLETATTGLPTPTGDDRAVLVDQRGAGRSTDRPTSVVPQWAGTKARPNGFSPIG